MKFSRFALLFVVGALGLVGCKPPVGDAAGATDSDPLQIVYIPKNTGNPYFNDVTRGFEAAAKEVGATFTTVGPATADPTSQLAMIKEQVQRGVDVLAISPNSPTALNPALSQARAKGVTIVTVDSDLTGNETQRDVAVIPADFSQIGAGQIELLGSMIGYEGEIAILSATTDAPNQNAWIETMKATLKDPKYAKMKLVDVVYGDDDPQKSTTECEALLSKHPALRGLIAPTTVGVAACAQAIEQRGVYPGGKNAKGEGLVLTGLGTPDQMRRFVKDGIVEAFQLWAPYNEGYIAAFVGAAIERGRMKPAAGVEVDVPELGKRKYSEKLELVGSPLVTFTKDNIDEYKF